MRALLALAAVGALGTGCDLADDPGPVMGEPGDGVWGAVLREQPRQPEDLERLLQSCGGPVRRCLQERGLHGTWHCLANGGGLFDVQGGGRLRITNALGQSSTGCIDCTGAWETMSTADTGGPVSSFVAFGTLTPGSQGTPAERRWRWCLGDASLEGCHARADGQARDACQRIDPATPGVPTPSGVGTRMVIP